MSQEKWCNGFYCPVAYIKKTVFLSVLLLIISFTGRAQNCPLSIVNNSGTIANNQIYWAILGQSPTDVWSYVNISNGQLLEMNVNDNTIVDPNGKPGPGGHNPGVYSNYFYKFDQFPSVNIPMMKGARIFISVGSPLYLYNFGGSGGYAGINLSNVDDPNRGILYEVIEFTHDALGFHGNTTRVDEFSFPISMQLEAAGGFNKFVGEFIDYNTIMTGFAASIPAAFSGCINGKKLLAPGKGDFIAGGSQANYFDSYINDLWTKYRTATLDFKTAQGEFTGHVIGDVFYFTRKSDNAAANISRKPTTIEILEGSGVMAQNNGNANNLDKVVQAMFCAAVNRHVVENASWSKMADYYQTAPCNYYAKYWHQASISYGQLAYGFCYDDVFNQSSLLESNNPTKVTIRLGGAGTTDLTGGNTVNSPPVPTVGGTAGACSGKSTTTTSANNVDYTYSFVPSGNSVTVTFTCTSAKSGLVPVMQNKSGGFVEEVIGSGASTSQTFTYNAGDMVTVSAKWMFAGGDATTKDYVFQIGSKCLTTDVEDITSGAELKTYPNPVNDLLTIEWQNPIISLQLFDLMGNKVFESTPNATKATINTESIAKGNYFVNIIDANNNMNHKFIIKL